MSKGHQLADGSWSSEYKIGDRFTVYGESSTFQKGSVVEFLSDDGSRCPLFRLVSGRIINDFTKDGDRDYVSWKYLNSVQKPFAKADLKCGMRVTHRDGDEYYYVDGMLVDVVDEHDMTDVLDLFGTKEDYDEDLNHIRHRNCDIIKVTDRDGAVLFERESIEQKLVLVTDEVREMTIGEIQAKLGFHVKIVEG